MRCEDLTRELASPTGRLSSTEMAEHLAGCPGCAGRSRRADQLDRIWDATRPDEPSSDRLDTLWARASAALDANPRPALDTIRFEGKTPRRSWSRPALVLGSVAAALLVVSLVLLRQFGDGDEPARVVAAADVPHLVAELDRPMLVSIDKNNEFTVSHISDPEIESSQLPGDTSHDLFNELESGASPASSSLASR